MWIKPLLISLKRFQSKNFSMFAPNIHKSKDCTNNLKNLTYLSRRCVKQWKNLEEIFLLLLRLQNSQITSKSYLITTFRSNSQALSMDFSLDSKRVKIMHSLQWNNSNSSLPCKYRSKFHKWWLRLSLTQLSLLRKKNMTCVPMGRLVKINQSQHSLNLSSWTRNMNSKL